MEYADPDYADPDYAETEYAESETNDNDQSNTNVNLEVTYGASDLHEVNLATVSDDEFITLREPSDVYMDIYRNAREKAKRMRKAAAEAYLEARQIRTQYLLDEIDSSDDCDDITDLG